MKIKRITNGEYANIYVISPYEDVYADDMAKLIAWLDLHFPGDYVMDNWYLTIVPEAETFLALTFDFV